MKECHDNIGAGHFSEERTIERVKTTSWWKDWNTEVTNYIKTCEAFRNSDKQKGKRFGLLQTIQEPTKRWEIFNMNFIMGLPPGGSYSYNSLLVLVDR